MTSIFLSSSKVSRNFRVGTSINANNFIEEDFLRFFEILLKKLSNVSLFSQQNQKTKTYAKTYVKTANIYKEYRLVSTKKIRRDRARLTRGLLRSNYTHFEEKKHVATGSRFCAKTEDVFGPTAFGEA